VGLAVGVIMDTFVVRTILVPCTVVLLGRWNWWPSTITMEPAQSGPDAVGASAEALGLASDAPADEQTDSKSPRGS
jgi:putative drug exporter of the RND superfamily